MSNYPWERRIDHVPLREIIAQARNHAWLDGKADFSYGCKRIKAIRLDDGTVQVKVENA